MLENLGYFCLLGAVAGIVLLVIQVFSLARHLSAAPPRPARLVPISILKPLCGLDENLADLLEEFAHLDYPDYEVLLGVRDTLDPAWPVATRAALRHPDRLRVILQKSEPGLNPKVNQLVTLADHALHDLLVISDSNVSVGRSYLKEIAGYLCDPTVGLVTHPIAGVGEKALGALLDNVHMAAGVAIGMVSASRLANKPLVVGKSIAMRRSDIDALGGFRAVKDVLAEDYVLGWLVTRELGKRAVVARRPIFSVAEQRTVREFYNRYRRWNIMNRRVVGLPIYLSEILLFPVTLSLAAFAFAPGIPTAVGALLIGSVRIACDDACIRMLRPVSLSTLALLAFPIRELLLFAAWADGMFRRHVMWRGNRLFVGPLTALTPPLAETEGDVLVAEEEFSYQRIVGS